MTVRQLFEEVAQMKGVNIDAFQLKFADITFDVNRDGHKLLKDYGFLHGDNIVFVHDLHGGSGLTPWSGHVWLTKDPCCVTDDDDPSEWRAKLACGHGVAVETVLEMVDATLRDGGYEFFCPKCGIKVNFTVYRHIMSADRSSEELLQLTGRVTKNALKKQQRQVKKCRKCGTFGQRNFARLRNNVNRVVCDTCTSQQGREIPFCWSCGKTWHGNGKVCGNPNCEGVEGELRVLRNCKTKIIGKVGGCPDTRACPRCGQLISHTDMCKHMHCSCGCNFCFVCLKTQDSSGHWRCGGAYEPCSVAPRQQTLPTY